MPLQFARKQHAANGNVALAIAVALIQTLIAKRIIENSDAVTIVNDALRLLPGGAGITDKESIEVGKSLLDLWR